MNIERPSATAPQQEVTKIKIISNPKIKEHPILGKKSILTFKALGRFGGQSMIVVKARMISDDYQLEDLGITLHKFRKARIKYENLPYLTGIAERRVEIVEYRPQKTTLPNNTEYYLKTTLDCNFIGNLA